MKYMIASFTNGSILFYDINSQQLLKQLKPLTNCSSTRPHNSNIFIDDWCSMVAYIHPNEQVVQISLVEWQYTCGKLVKPKLSRHQYETKRKVDRMQKLLKTGIKAMVEKEMQRLADQTPFDRFKQRMSVSYE